MKLLGLELKRNLGVTLKLIVTIILIVFSLSTFIAYFNLIGSSLDALYENYRDRTYLLVDKEVTDDRIEYKKISTFNANSFLKSIYPNAEFANTIGYEWLTLEVDDKRYYGTSGGFSMSAFDNETSIFSNIEIEIFNKKHKKSPVIVGEGRVHDDYVILNKRFMEAFNIEYDEILNKKVSLYINYRSNIAQIFEDVLVKEVVSKDYIDYENPTGDIYLSKTSDAYKTLSNHFIDRHKVFLHNIKDKDDVVNSLKNQNIDVSIAHTEIYRVIEYLENQQTSIKIPLSYIGGALILALFMSLIQTIHIFMDKRKYWISIVRSYGMNQSSINMYLIMQLLIFSFVSIGVSYTLTRIFFKIMIMFNVEFGGVKMNVSQKALNDILWTNAIFVVIITVFLSIVTLIKTNNQSIKDVLIQYKE